MRIRSPAGAVASILAAIGHRSANYPDSDIGLFENDRAAVAYLQMRPTRRPPSGDFEPDISEAL